MIPGCPWCKTTYKSIDSRCKVTSLNKIDFASPVSQQLPMAPQLEVGRWKLLLCLPWDSGCLDLVRVLWLESQLLWVHMCPESVSSYVPCHVQKTLSCAVIQGLWLLQSFAPLSRVTELWKERNVLELSHVGPSSPQSLTLWTLINCRSL